MIRTRKVASPQVGVIPQVFSKTKMQEYYAIGLFFLLLFQDPFIYSGTLLYNLDPLGLFPKETVQISYVGYRVAVITSPCRLMWKNRGRRVRHVEQFTAEKTFISRKIFKSDSDWVKLLKYSAWDLCKFRKASTALTLALYTLLKGNILMRGI